MSIQLQLETTSVCDAKCCFCPYPIMKRAHGTMEMGVFKKIIDEAATLPHIDHITLTGLGETLLDRHLIPRLKYIRSKMPTVLLDLFTNGSQLRPTMTDALIDAGLSVLYVSLNALTREKRREIMQLDDFDRVVEYIEYARTVAVGKMQVIVKAIASKDLMEIGENKAFVDRWDGPHKDPGGAAFLHLEGNWAGALGQKLRTTPTEACGRALGQIMVLQDGRVSLCCFDAHGEMILGDLKTQTIREIYNGDPALGIRLAHVEGRRAEVALCRDCTGI